MLAANLVINKTLQTKSINLIKNNNLDVSFFAGYENEFNFILEHYKKYGNIPDELPFAEKFPDFDAVLVNETDDYLIDKLHEEYGFQKFCQFLPDLDKLIKEDSRLAYNYLKEQMPNLKPRTCCKGFDIISGAEERYSEYLERQNSKTPLYISSGFPEIDEIFGGWAYGEELVTIIARTGTYKSWVINKFLLEAWKQGKRVGLYSGEMSAIKSGYRFDALYKGFSNRCLTRGKQIDGYEEYINETKSSKNPFIVVTQNEFGGRPTVQQLQTFVESNNLDILGVDQLSLMTDGRASKNDPMRLRFAHITEDLFSLSTECKIPILALAQVNRDGLKRGEDNTPGLENIKESDDISHNSSKCISLNVNKDKNTLVMNILKNREGLAGNKLHYLFNIDIGFFEYLPISDDAVESVTRQKVIADNKQNMANKTIYNPF